MNINDYILKEIKALTLQSSVKEALRLCKELPITHLPIVDEHKLLGCFAESDVHTFNDLDKPLEAHAHLLQYFYAQKSSTLLELISLFADNDTNLVPILDKKQHYIGYYELADILDVYASCPYLHDSGETIIIEKNKHDYSMSEIAQIVESHDAKLLGCYISDETIEIVHVNVKISSLDINEVLQTFRRYDYTIISNHTDDAYAEDLKNRTDYLNRYLDM